MLLEVSLSDDDDDDESIHLLSCVLCAKCRVPREERERERERALWHTYLTLPYLTSWYSYNAERGGGVERDI